jgi:uncharacterized membrane protein YdjX (TVP38/TMEM64 family)
MRDTGLLKQTVAVAGLAGLAFWVWLSYRGGGIMALLLDTRLNSADKIQALQTFFESWGSLAPIVYVGLVLVEAVIAPIPGAILYLPGGVIFGGLWGGTLSLAGNVLAAGLCCWLMRTMTGRKWLEDSAQEGRLPALKTFILRHGVLSIALLRVNPLTSSDIVSYAAGLTPLSIRTVMFGTLFGMAPLCYLQAYLSVEIFARFPWLIWPFLAACVVYAVLVAYLLMRPGRRRRPRVLTDV